MYVTVGQSALQLGFVREIAAVSLTRSRAAGPAKIVVAADRLPAGMAHIAKPMDAYELSNALRTDTAEMLDGLRAATQAGLDAAWRQFKGLPDVHPVPEPAEMLADPDLSEPLKRSVRAQLTAEESAGRLLIELPSPPRDPKRGQALVDQNNALIAQAVADQVDAHLATEIVFDDIDTAMRIAALELVSGDKDAALRFEMIRSAARDTARMAKRKEMIEDVMRDISRGKVFATVTRRTVWAHQTTSVLSDESAAVSTYEVTRAHLAYGSVGVTARATP